MGFLQSLFHSRDKPKDQTAGSAFRFYFGHTTSGKAVTERSAMQITAVYACVRVLAEAVAGLPLHLFHLRGNAGKEKATDSPLYFLLHDEPNPEMTSFIFRETLMCHLLLWGNAYAQIIRNGKGEVVALYPLMANKMTVDRDENGTLYYEYQVSKSDVPTLKNGRVRLSPSEVLHIPGLGFDGLVGYSPIGVVKDPEKIRQSWEQGFGGSQNSNKVAILEEGMTYTPISISPEAAQFLETRKFQIDEIARIFRVPPHMIGDLEHATFSNIEHQSLEFVTYTLRPWLVRFEESMQRSLLLPEQKKDYLIRFNVDGILRGDYESRMRGYATGIQNGIFSVNDVRRLEDMDLLSKEDGGDLHVLNGNVVKLADAGSAYTKNKEDTDEPTEEILEMDEKQKSRSKRK